MTPEKKRPAQHVEPVAVLQDAIRGKKEYKSAEPKGKKKRPGMWDNERAGAQKEIRMNTRYATDMWGEEKAKERRTEAYKLYKQHKTTETSESKIKPLNI